MNEKMTELFSGDVKPVHVGVYQRISPLMAEVYSKWDGIAWFEYCRTVDLAYLANCVSEYQSLAWRGLAEKP